MKTSTFYYTVPLLFSFNSGTNLSVYFRRGRYFWKSVVASGKCCYFWGAVSFRTLQYFIVICVTVMIHQYNRSSVK